jgi:hypothetical protein
VFGASSRITSWVPIEGAEAIGIGYGILYRVSSPARPLVVVSRRAVPAVDTRRGESVTRMVPV